MRARSERVFVRVSHVEKKLGILRLAMLLFVSKIDKFHCNILRNSVHVQYEIRSILSCLELIIMYSRQIGGDLTQSRPRSGRNKCVNVILKRELSSIPASSVGRCSDYESHGCEFKSHYGQDCLIYIFSMRIQFIRGKGV